MSFNLLGDLLGFGECVLSSGLLIKSVRKLLLMVVALEWVVIMVLYKLLSLFRREIYT